MLAAALLTNACWLLTVVPVDTLARDGVERFELNNFYDAEGRLVFTQLVGWEADETVRFWKMAKTSDMVPQPDVYRGGYVLTWLDGDTLRQVRARSFAESWTQIDVETENRNYLPAEKRRGLRGGR